MLEHERRARVLVGIARGAMADPLADVTRAGWAEDWLKALAATFVTLRQEGELRGCIGSVEARRALGEDVARNAVAAAYRDPRFSPVAAHEVERLEVEISILSPRVPVRAESESEALAQLRPGVDGVFLEYEEHQATFLPQVWDAIPDPLGFLSQLRLKARLPARFWHPRLCVSRYTVEKYR